MKNPAKNFGSRPWRQLTVRVAIAAVALTSGAALANAGASISANAQSEFPPFHPTGLPGETNAPRVQTFHRESPVFYEGNKKFSEAQAVALARTTDLIVDVKRGFRTLVPAMKAANPNLKVLVYLNGTFAQSNQGSTYPSSLYARSASGSQIRSYGWGNYLMQITSPAWQADRAATCREFMANGPNYDGCFLDMVGVGALSRGYLNGVPVVQSTQTPWSVSYWESGVSNIIAKVKAVSPHAILEGNGIGDGARWFNPALHESTLTSETNIVMAEDWGINSRSPLTSFYSVPRWQQDVDTIVDVEAHGGSVEATVKAWGPGTAAELAQWHSFSLASFMLGTGGHSYYSFEANTSTAPSQDSSLEHLNVGSPLGAYGYSQGAFVRYFSNGLAVVNPGTTAVSYTLPPGTYTTEVGGSYTGTVTLAPHTGHVVTLVGI